LRVPPRCRYLASLGRKYLRRPLRAFESQPDYLATWQSTAWLGAEAGVFKKRGIDMTLPAIAVGGPEAAAGLIRGDWEFAHTGTVPVAEEVLKGRDVVILATPTSDFSKSLS
jgi:ABC-type nitrate/sulfonate/bicarbonate transport system substrate-binding protein